MSELLATFSTNVRATREGLGLSQEAAADAAGMDQSQWWKLENAKIDPSIKTLVRVAAALGVTAADLLRDVG